MSSANQPETSTSTTKAAKNTKNTKNTKSTTTIIVSDLNINDITPVIANERANAILQNDIVLRPAECSFVISGVSTAIANGLRRTISSGVSAYRLSFDLTDMETNDPFMKLGDFVRDRINAIPIMQNVDGGLVLKLDYKNATAIPAYVYTSDLVVVTGKQNIIKTLFDRRIPIVQLQATKYIRIDKIFIERGYEYNHGSYALSSGATCVPLDQEMFNMYTGVGVSSAVAAPRKHKISFETNGNIQPLDLIKRACAEITDRLDKIKLMLHMIVPIADYHKLVINGEDDTTGNIIVSTVCELYPTINACNYKVDHVNKVLTISIRCPDPNDILTMSIMNAIETIEAISAGIIE